MKISDCNTCEWRFQGGVCANSYYGEKIKDIKFDGSDKKCGGWNISLKEYLKMNPCRFCEKSMSNEDCYDENIRDCKDWEIDHLHYQAFPFVKLNIKWKKFEQVLLTHKPAFELEI